MQVTAESHESAPKEAEKQLEARHLSVIPRKGVDHKGQVEFAGRRDSSLIRIKLPAKRKFYM